MAENKTLFRISFSSFLFFLFSSSAISRTSPSSTYQTTILNVSRSLHRARQIFSSDPYSVQSHDSSSSESTTMALQLLPRASVLKPSSHAADYKSLTLARLDRDSARVRSILAKRDFVVNGLTGSDLNPEVMGLGADSKLGAAITSGTSQGSGEYFVRIGVGTPPQSTYMVLDTGSDVNWIQCSPCSECYQQSDPIFDPSSSSTYNRLACGSSQCKSLDLSTCHNGSCLYEVSYGDGSFTLGDFVTERLTLGDDAVEDVAMGCGHTNDGLFVGSDGLLGLGGGALSFPSQINASSFSYCLVDRDSRMASTLDFGASIPFGSVTAPLLKNSQMDTFYYVRLKGLSVGGVPVEIAAPSFEMNEEGAGVIIDSGTAVTRLQVEAYDALRSAFVKGTLHLKKVNGVSMFDTCYDFSSIDSVEVPTVSLNFHGGDFLVLPAQNYMIPVDDKGTFCFAFAPTSSSLSIIGNVQQQGTRVTYDLTKNLVAFSPKKC